MIHWSNIFNGYATSYQQKKLLFGTIEFTSDSNVHSFWSKVSKPSHFRLLALLRIIFNSYNKMTEDALFDAEYVKVLVSLESG